MESKKGFWKGSWFGLLSILIVAMVAFVRMNLVLFVFAGVGSLVFINQYRTYDAELDAVGDWWSGLSKKEKLRIQGGQQ